MSEERVLTYAEAINESTRELMRKDESVLVMGLGVPTPTGVFGTTSGLLEEFGPRRVLDTPAAENGMTGVAVGMAISGLRPIMVHHRVDFGVLSMEPIVNQAAKWHFMYGGKATAPLTIRMIVGRGWGQGPQHSQSLQAWFAHIPGLQVLMPVTPNDAHELLQHSVRGSRPTLILEHRWLYDITGPVIGGTHEVDPISVMADGTDISIVATSYMALESLKARTILAQHGVSAQVIALKQLSPLPKGELLRHIGKTGRLLVVDNAHTSFGVAAEVIAAIAEQRPSVLSDSPRRLCLPDVPTPTAPSLTRDYYPRAEHIARTVLEMFSIAPRPDHFSDELDDTPHDVPNQTFRGPY